jgi:predicted phosphodiesterase
MPRWFRRVLGFAFAGAGAFAPLAGAQPIVADDVGLVRVAALWRWAPATTPTGSLPPGWTTGEFNDAHWSTGSSGFAGDATGAEATLLSASPLTGAVCFRHRFIVPDPTTIAWLVLRVDWSGGFVAYLNGTEIARRQFEVPSDLPVPFDAVPLARTKGLAEEIDVTAALPLLTAGENVLALQWHPSPGVSGSGVVPELLANFTRGPFVQRTTPTAQTIVWRTPTATDTTVEFGETMALGEAVREATAVRQHVATLTGLKPDTHYFYRVRSSDGLREAVSPLLQFRTFKTAGPMSFMVAADMGSGRLSQYRVADLLRTHDPDLVLAPGDTVYPTFQDPLADARFFSVYRRQMTHTPFFAVAGNHDVFYGASPSFFEAFVSPTNSVSLADHVLERTGPGHYYAFDHGDVRFVGLHVPMYYLGHELLPHSAQVRWLEADLAATAKPWRILFLHLPLFSSGPHANDDYNYNQIPDSQELTEVLLPIARRHGVQVIFSAHDHAYERFHPVDGVLCVVSAGGGGTLYSKTVLHPASAQFHYRWHATHVSVEGDALHLRAIDDYGNVFDECFLQRQPPPPPSLTPTTAWHTPVFAPDAPDDGDGNRIGQRFAFAGTPLLTAPGEFSNLGRVWVNRDHTHLYVGLERVMIPRDANVFLFLESPARPGVSTLAGLGNNRVDPEEQGADGLDFLENLSFRNFRPALACVLGDEFADAQFRSFRRTNVVAGTLGSPTIRTNLALDIGQGGFALDPTFSDIPGVRLEQFNRSPQTEPVPGEQNADFIQVALPLSALGLSGGETFRLGAVVGGGAFSTDPDGPNRALDRSFLGLQLEGSGQGAVVLEGLPLELGPDLDADGDGLLLEDELVRGTDPHHPDTDRDGLPDGWEVAHGLDPLTPTGSNGPGGDPDGDGLTNAAEFIAGTRPNDPRSGLRLGARLRADGQLEFRWASIPGRRYRLEFAPAFTGPFQPVPPHVDPSPAHAHETVTTLPPPAPGADARWYRVSVWP